MTEHNFEHMRRAMVASQLRTTGVNDPRVVAAMGAVPRERFVPEQYVSAAYTDFLVPLGHGRELNSPMAIGRMLSESRLQGHEHVLVVGAASVEGHQHVTVRGQHLEQARAERGDGVGQRPGLQRVDAGADLPDGV